MSDSLDHDRSASDRAVGHGLPPSTRRVHFVGVGGVGMSGVAEMMTELGYQVSGSDQFGSPTTARLRDLGVAIKTGHDARWVGEADAVIVSAAVPGDNPELTEAHRRQLPVIQRGAMLARLARSRSTVAITGTHGKSTTSSMIAVLLADCGLDPSVVVGAKIKAFGSNIRSGNGPHFVLEADESEPSLLELTPRIAVVTNLEAEHLDHYGTFAALQDTMVSFANRVVDAGVVVVCADDPEMVRLRSRITGRVMTYGLENRSADVIGYEPVFKSCSSGCLLKWRHKEHLEPFAFEVGVPGRHNLLNGMAAFATAMELGLDPNLAAASIQKFTGVERRFHFLGAVGGVSVIDDYGHHPTEIDVVLSTARNQPHQRLVAVFQPHRYTRTARFFAEFARVLSTADIVILTDIFAAGEPPIPGITSESLAMEIRLRRASVHYVAKLEDVVSTLAGMVGSGDLVVTLGAGSIGTVGTRVLEALRQSKGRVGIES